MAGRAKDYEFAAALVKAGLIKKDYEFAAALVKAGLIKLDVLAKRVVLLEIDSAVRAGNVRWMESQRKLQDAR